MNSILRHVAEAFPPARQGTILNSHRVIGIATNTSMVLNFALVTDIGPNNDSRCWTAECSLTSYPGLRGEEASQQLHDRDGTHAQPLVDALL